MPRPVPVDLILHALAEVLLETIEYNPRHLARLIANHCVDRRSLADQWCDGADVATTARLLACLLDPPTDDAAGASPRHEPHPKSRHTAVAVARRLADVGLSLAVTGAGDDRRDGEALVRAATSLVFPPQTIALAGPQGGTVTIAAGPIQTWIVWATNLLDGEFTDGVSVETDGRKWRVMWIGSCIAIGEQRREVERSALERLRQR